MNTTVCELQLIDDTRLICHPFATHLPPKVKLLRNLIFIVLTRQSLKAFIIYSS